MKEEDLNLEGDGSAEDGPSFKPGVVSHQVDHTQRYLTIDTYRLLIFVCIPRKLKKAYLDSYLKGTKTDTRSSSRPCM
jgi:hypothetical protein